MTAGLEEHGRSVAQCESGVPTGAALGVDGGGEEGGTEWKHFALRISTKIKSVMKLHVNVYNLYSRRAEANSFFAYALLPRSR